MSALAEIPFLMEVTLNVCRRACGVTGFEIPALFAIRFTALWVVRADIPKVCQIQIDTAILAAPDQGV